MLIMTQDMSNTPNRTHAQNLVTLRTGREVADLLRDLYVSQGLSQETIAENLGLTRNTVAMWLREFGIDRADRRPGRRDPLRRRGVRRRLPRMDSAFMKAESFCLDCGGPNSRRPRCRPCARARRQPTEASLLARLSANVQISPDGCWEWIGHRTPYVIVTAKGFRPGRRKWSAHRLSWELHFGPNPDGLWVLHLCDNPPCVNPAHLFLGTPTDNARDMLAKGRGRWNRPR
jgi:DNA-binding XRE family transcriptional regulator